MTTIAFDTLAYAKKMKSVGFTDQQAEAQAQGLAEIMDSNFCTKHDIVLLKKDIREIEYVLKKDIKELEYKLTIRMGGMMVAAVSFLGYLIKFGH